MKNLKTKCFSTISALILFSCQNTIPTKSSTATSSQQNAILFKNTLKYDKNKLKEFKASLKEGVDFAKINAPQLFIHVYIDEPKELAYSYQYYHSSEDVLKHWDVSKDKIDNVMNYSEVVRFEIFGDPSQEVVDGIDQVLDKSVVFYYKEFYGYDKFCEKY